MRCALAIALVALATAGCFGGPEKTTGGGLVASELEILADDVIKGPRGVYVIEGVDVQPIDPITGEASGDPIDAYVNPRHAAVDGEGVLWFVDTSEHTAYRFAPGGQRTTLEMPEGEAAGIALSDGQAWVSSADPPIVVPFSDDGSHGEPVETPCDLYTLVGTAGAVWGGCDMGVVRLDTKTRRAALIDTGGEPRTLAATSSRLWALVGGRLIAIDLDTGEIADRVDAPVGARLIAGAGDDLWVAAASGDNQRPDRITHHNAEDFTLVAGPVDVPGSTEDVGTQVSSMEAVGDDLWIAVLFYGGQLIVVRPEG